MFVGHYAASFVAKGLEPRASLALLFIAAQFLDFVLFPLVLLGGEQLLLVPNATQSTHFELPFMPYSHSIWAALFWSTIALIICRSLLNLSRTISLLVCFVVGSHWWLDLLVHTPDLAVWRIFSSDASKWGFSLWNNVYLSFAIETCILLLSVAFYLKKTHATSKAGKYLIPAFAALLLLVQAINNFGDLNVDSEAAFAWQAMIAFTVFVVVAGILDHHRGGGPAKNVVTEPLNIKNSSQ